MLGSWYIRASPPSPAEQAPGAQCTTPTHQRQQQPQPQIQMQMQIQPQPQRQSPPREQQLERVVVQNHATSCSTQSQAQAPVTESRGDITMTTGANDATPRQPPPKRLRSPPANETEGTRVDHSVQAPPLPPPSLSCAAILGEKVGGKGTPLPN
ncbi:hypothetical protein Pelo_964 [Pelomyxa schiedti]|nr:hypothetical protein Pelo_964 [Pelomyxa schiedti]